jgi:uncharacterized DUF497 family protein
VIESDLSLKNQFYDLLDSALQCHVYLEEDGLIRIISARKANNQEAPYYYR